MGKSMKFLQKSCISTRLQLYFMKRVPKGRESADTEHFFIHIGAKMVSMHEMQQIGIVRSDGKIIESSEKRRRENLCRSAYSQDVTDGGL